MEVTTHEVNTKIKYNTEWTTTIVGDISNKYDKWHGERASQIAWIKAVDDLLNMIDSLSKDKDGKIKLKDSAIRRIFRTIVARTYNATFKTPANMFTVSLKNKPTKDANSQFAYKQKQSLLNVLKKAKTKKELLEGIRNWVAKGELIYFVAWHQEWDFIRRLEGFKFLNINFQDWVIKKQLKYDGVKIISIDPDQFVYDVKRGDFDSALKIRPTWKTFQDIASNETYKEFLSKENLNKISDTVEGKTNTQIDIKSDIDTSKGYKDGMVEVLECYGDYTLKFEDKIEFFPNMKIIIIGREFVGCFKYNPYILNPYILHYTEKDPSTGRGVPPISGLVAISLAIESILNKYYTALGLSINKCWLARSGAFTGEMKIKENGIIEIGSGANAIEMPIPIEFRDGLQYALSGMEYFKLQQQDETQVYRQSAGDSTQQPQTLGQAKLLQQNQDIIESCDNDLFHDAVVIGVIEKMASYTANFKSGDELIKYKDEQGKEYVDVMDDTVRQANYEYFINDSSASIENKMNITEYIDIILQKIAPYMASTGQGVISATEIINQVGSAYEQEEPTKIIIQQQGGNIGQGTQVGNVPPESVEGLQDIKGLPVSTVG